MGIKCKKFKVGDLVTVDNSGFPLVVSEVPNINVGIVMKKMRTKGFYVVYHAGKYHKNVYCEWMRRLV